MLKNRSFLTENGELDLSTEKQLVEFLATVLKGEIILEEPHTFADMLLSTEQGDEEEDIFTDNPKFILGESEQMLRASFNDSDELVDTIDKTNNAFIYLYDTLDAVYNDATSTYLDTHSPGEFNIATHIVNEEIRQAKQALVVAKMLVTKALTNDLMMK